MSNVRTRPMTAAERKRYFELKLNSPNWREAVASHGWFLSSRAEALHYNVGSEQHSYFANQARLAAQSQRESMALFYEELAAIGFKVVTVGARAIINRKEETK